MECCRWRSEHGLRRCRAMDGMSVAAGATVGSHREAARTTSTRRAVAVRIRLMTDFTSEDYVERRAWPYASAPACPETHAAHGGSEGWSSGGCEGMFVTESSALARGRDCHACRPRSPARIKITHPRTLVKHPCWKSRVCAMNAWKPGLTGAPVQMARRTQSRASYLTPV